MKKKWMYIVCAVLVILIVTNPGIKSFKETETTIGSDSQYKLHNFFIFSTYRTYYHNGFFDYIGILGNFFEIDVYIYPPTGTYTKEPPIDSLKNSELVKPKK